MWEGDVRRIEVDTSVVQVQESERVGEQGGEHGSHGIRVKWKGGDEAIQA